MLRTGDQGRGLVGGGLPACLNSADGLGRGVRGGVGDRGVDIGAEQVDGEEMKLGPTGSVIAAATAESTRSVISSGRWSSTAYFVMGRMTDTESRHWWVSLGKMSCDSDWAASAITGERSRIEVATPVARFVIPGPSVAQHACGRPVMRARTSAATPAVNSCRVRTKSIPGASSKRMEAASRPTTPNTVSTPCSWRRLSSACAAVGLPLGLVDTRDIRRRLQEVDGKRIAVTVPVRSLHRLSSAYPTAL